MAERQLHSLNRSRLNALKADEYYLRLEPFTLSEKRAKKMGPGDMVLLGKRPPLLEVARNREKVASAVATEHGIRVGPPTQEDFSEAGEPRRIRYEGHLGLLLAAASLWGELLELPLLSLEAIDLFDEKGRHRAHGRLVAREEGYALEILERSYG